ncbi:MAG TPA: hypothetical protein VMT51_07965 [Dongiaceae bacterium]|nr:hypothetical protein [Dongiaceae bacterium]
MTNHASSLGSGAAQIVIARDTPDDVQIRQIVVFLDGKRQAELLFGQSVRLETSPGAHTLRVDNTWNHREIAVEASADETLRYAVKNSAGQFSRFLLTMFGAGPIYVSIEQVEAQGGAAG